MQRVRIRNQPTVVLAGRGTVLSAALDAGVPFPHDCRTGTCGACKARLLDGKVEMLPHAPEALNPAEEASGLILACRARARTDLEVEWLGEADEERPPVRALKAEVAEIAPIARDVTRLRLRILGNPMYFAAGQYADLSFGRRP
ncbi:MAG: 2Fe-2S iron-sulfur cluster-binding protein, partial [Myxococcota bacterium]